MSSPRVAEVTRQTAETQIRVKVNLDGTGQSSLFDRGGGHGGSQALIHQAFSGQKNGHLLMPIFSF